MKPKQGIHTYFILFFLLGSALQAFSQHNWDSLYLKNGQVVFGELKRISLGMVQFKIEDLNEVSLKMSKIKTLKATSHLYRIETINRQVFFSTIEPAQKEGYVRVGDSSGGAEIPLEYIGLLSYYSEKKNLFEGNVSAGFNYTKSSNIGRLTLDATLKYIMKKFILKNILSAMVTSDQGEWFRERESILFSGTYLIDSKWKSIALLNYQRNKELGLESRFQEGAGLGYSLLSNSKTRLGVMSGFVVNQEKSFTDENSSLTAEVPVVVDFDFFKFTKPEISVANYHNFYFSLTDKGRIRYDGELRADWKVVTDFYLNMKFYFNYDSKPLSGTGTTFDYGTVLGFTYKWD